MHVVVNSGVDGNVMGTFLESRGHSNVCDSEIVKYKFTNSLHACETKRSMEDELGDNER